MSLALFVLTCRLTARFCSCTLLDICDLLFHSSQLRWYTTSHFLLFPRETFSLIHRMMSVLVGLCVPRVLNLVKGCHEPSEIEWEFGIKHNNSIMWTSLVTIRWSSANIVEPGRVFFLSSYYSHFWRVSVSIRLASSTQLWKPILVNAFQTG